MAVPLAAMLSKAVEASAKEMVKGELGKSELKDAGKKINDFQESERPREYDDLPYDDDTADISDDDMDRPSNDDELPKDLEDVDPDKNSEINESELLDKEEDNIDNDSNDSESDTKRIDDCSENEDSSVGEDDNDTDEEKGTEKETDELTQEEIDELQKKAIAEAFEKIANGEELTDVEKGNLGEMLMDQYYTSLGYTPIHKPRVTDLKTKSGQGIDGVYEKTNPDGSKSYIIADAKVNYSKLSKGLADGTDQMSDAWIDKRLDSAVGKEKADEIRDAYEDNPSSVSKEVYHFSYSDKGNGLSEADVTTVDEDGNLNKDKEVVQVFDQLGNDISGGEDYDKG